MELKEYLEAKHKLERRIADYLNNAVQEFNSSLGDVAVVEGMYVHVVDTSTMGHGLSSIVSEVSLMTRFKDV